MNIFYLDSDPKTCSEFHVDKHCVKMILEYAQLLSSAHHILDNYQGDDIYKLTHKNHPSAIWTRDSKENYEFLFNLWIALMDEYTYRYGKVHASSRLIDVLSVCPKNSQNKPFTEPTPAMPEEFVVPGDSIQSYRNYYVGAKSNMFSWKNRECPYWIDESNFTLVKF